jgi:hypothetical protein
MADIKLKGSELSLVNTASNTVSLGSLVRMINTDSAAKFLITQKNSDTTTLGTITLNAAGTGGDEVFLIKDPTDTLESNTSATGKVLAVSIGYF